MINEYLQIIDMVSGICCLLAAVFLHFSYIPDSRFTGNYRRGGAFVKIACLLLGISSLVFASVGLADYGTAKMAFIGILIPPETLLVVWGLIHLIFMRRKFRLIMLWQTVFTGLQCIGAVVYYLFLKGEASGLVYVLLVLCYSVHFLFYTYIYYSVSKQWFRTLRSGKLRFRLRPLRVWAASFMLGSLLISSAFFINPVYISFLTVAYSLFFIFFCIEYHNYGVDVSQYLLALSRSLPRKANTLSGSSEKTQQLIADRLVDWQNGKGFLQPGVTIQSLCHIIGVSRTYLSNYINDTYHTNFNTWVNNLRVEEAKLRILSSSDISMGDLAEQVGFSDQAHFSRYFKQKEGIPPSLWRKEFGKSSVTGAESDSAGVER